MKKQLLDASILKSLLPLKVLRKNFKTGFDVLNMVNRPIGPGQVSKIATAVTKIGLIRPVVVALLNLKNFKGYYIIDGQHLYHACIRLNLDIPYVVITIDSEKELVDVISMVNNSSKAWTLKDYVQAWSFIMPQYKKLAKYRQTYDLELVAIAGILHKSANIFSSMDIIKNGTLTIKDEATAVKVMKYTNDVLAILNKGDRKNARKLINGYVQFVTSNIDTYESKHVKFLKNIQKQKDKLELVAVSTDTIAEFFYKICLN